MAVSFVSTIPDRRRSYSDWSCGISSTMVRSCCVSATRRSHSDVSLCTCWVGRVSSACWLWSPWTSLRSGTTIASSEVQFGFKGREFGLELAKLHTEYIPFGDPHGSDGGSQLSQLPPQAPAYLQTGDASWVRRCPHWWDSAGLSGPRAAGEAGLSSPGSEQSKPCHPTNEGARESWGPDTSQEMEQDLSWVTPVYDVAVLRRSRRT